MGGSVGAGKLSARVEAKVGVDVKLLDAETVYREFSPVDHWTTK
jgi:hypothetical protein